MTVTPPTFDPGAGSYTTAQSVTLSDTTPGATIYYTTDGSPATASSTVYSAVIPVNSGTVTINAMAAVGSNSSTMSTATYTVNVGPSISGTVMSGTLPEDGASVQMYAAGLGGYGTAATLQSTTAAMTGSDGTFTLNYNCPEVPGDLVYLVATGGHTGTNSGSNAGLAFMAALGSCKGTLPKPLVNEATTVASVYSLSQFIDWSYECWLRVHGGQRSGHYQCLQNREQSGGPDDRRGARPYAGLSDEPGRGHEHPE